MTELCRRSMGGLKKELNKLRENLKNELNTS